MAKKKPEPKVNGYCKAGDHGSCWGGWHPVLPSECACECHKVTKKKRKR